MTKKEIREKLKKSGYTLINSSYHDEDGLIIFNAFDDFGDPYKFSIIPDYNYAVRVRLSEFVLYKESNAANIFF